MARVGEIVFGAPVAAVNKKHDRVRTLVLRDADIDKLIGIAAVGKAQVGMRR